MTGNSRVKWNWVALLSTLIASGFHTYLANQHYKLVFGVSESGSICNINQTFNCDAVNMSSYSELFGVPIAIWGLVTNLVLALLLFWNSISGWNSSGRRVIFYLATFIALMSVIMGSISSFLIHSFCLFCAVTYVLSVTTWFAVYKTMEPGTIKGTLDYIQNLSRGREAGYVAFLLVIPLSGFALNSMITRSFVSNLDIVIEESILNWKANQENTFDVKSSLVTGPDSSKMTIVEFADFLCGHCKHAAPTLDAFVKSRPDVKFVFQNFPLDGTCNPAISGPGMSCPLAKSVYCSEKLVGKGWEAHHFLFENQGQTDANQLQKSLSIPEEAFKDCLNSTETHEAIASQAKQGQVAGVRGTPAIFVNGKLLPGAQLMPVLIRAYRELN